MEKLEIEITADTSKLKQNLNSARDDIKGFNERAKSETAIELSVKVATLKAQLQNVRQLLKTDIPQSVAIELSAKSELLKRDVTQAGRELTNFLRTGQTDVSVLGNLFSNLGNGIKNVFTGNIKDAMADFKWSFNGIGSAIGSAWTALVGLFAGSQLISFFSDATREALAFQKAMVQIKTVTEGTATEYNNLSKSIMNIAEQTGVASIELAKTAVTIAQAGVAVKDIPSVLETVTKAAVVNGSDSTVVFQGLTSAASIYGIKIQDLMQVSDLFFRANAEGKLDVQDLSNAIGTVAPIANTAGVSLKELVAGFATMTRETGNADEVATQLKGSIQAIAAPSAEAIVAARQLGIELGAQAIASKGYAGVIKDIYDKTDGNLGKIKEIIPEVRALTAVTFLGGQANEKYKENLDGLNNSLGDTEKAFGKYSDSEVATIAKSQQTWNNWKIQIGESFTFFFAVLINSATYLNKWIQLGVAVVGEFVLAFGTGFVLIGDALGQLLFFLINNMKIQGANLVKITENLAFNMGQAFNDIPWTVAKALNSALNSVLSFFSKSLEKYNEFVDFIGQSQLKVNSKITDTGISSENIGPKFRDLTEGTNGFDTSFNLAITKKGVDAMGRGLADIQGKWADLTTTIKEGTKATENNIGASTNQAKTADKQIVTLDSLNKKLVDLKAKLGGTEIGTKGFKDLQNEIVKTQKEVDDLNSGTKKTKWVSASAQASKELKDQKKQIEDTATADIKAVEKTTLSQSDKAKKIVAINKKMKEDLLLIDGKYYENELRRSEEFLKNEEQDVKERKALREKDYKDLSDKEKKQLEDIQKLGTAYADLKNKLAEVGKKWADDIKAINDEIEKLQKNLANIQSKGKKDVAGRLVEAQKELKDLQDLSNAPDYQGRTEEQIKKMAELEKEIALGMQNTSADDRAKALEESQKSKTQLLLDEIALNEQKAKDELAQAEAKKVSTQAQIDLETKAIKDKMDAIAIQITSETTIMISEDAKRRKLEADYTAFFGEQIAQRKTVMDELIQKAQQASLAIQSAGIGTMSGTATATSNSTANSIVQNITNNQNVDAESFLRSLNNKLPTK